MKKEIDIYNYPNRMECALNGLKKSKILDKNKETILAFRDSCSLESMSLPRMIRYVGVLKDWAELLDKDFYSATKQDIINVVRIIQEKNNYSPWTKSTYKVMLKRFYKWLRGTSILPEEVSWIKATIKRTEEKQISNGELLTEEEVKKLIYVAEHPRDKALIACLYETGTRIGELASMQLFNVKFDEHGALLNVTGKTGPRIVRIIFATPYLVTWINNHPLKDDPKAPLWLKHGYKNDRGPVGYAGIKKMLRDLFEKACLKKRCNPHLFRHSRATFMADHLTEFQMNQYFGWIQGSGMPSTYVHMSGKNLDASILALNGIATPQTNKESQFKPKICPRCNTMNTTEAKYCVSCAGNIEITKVQESQKNNNEMMARMLKDKEFMETFVNKIKELGLVGKNS